MLVRTLVVGPLSVNCYIVACADTHSAMVIDPGGNAHEIIREAERLGVTVESVVCTHGHFDHALAVAEVVRLTGARLLIHALDAPMLSDPSASLATWLGSAMPAVTPTLLLQGGECLAVGNASLRVVHTPGHTPGSISLRGDAAAFVGDMIFRQGIGRTDLPGGDFKVLLASINAILTLPDETALYPGHGDETTVGEEKRFNPYLQP